MHTTHVHLRELVCVPAGIVAWSFSAQPNDSTMAQQPAASGERMLLAVLECTHLQQLPFLSLCRCVVLLGFIRLDVEAGPGL